jgi:tetratricopeptide (TPR) repeat protein
VDRFELELETDAQEGILRLRLKDRDGKQLGHNLVRLADHPRGLLEGIFDTREYVRRCRGAVFQGSPGPATPEYLVARLGVFLANDMLGPGIMEHLLKWHARRTLLIRLPPMQKEGKNDWLAVAVARIPWEIARPSLDHAPLMERNLLVRGLPDELGGARPPVARLADDEPLRVLFVYAEAPGSRPLAMRLERERLRELFYDEILPERRVEFDVLCHGVTKERLESQIRKAKGYHIVHWSGHGWYDLLELRGKDGKPDYLTGSDIVKLFVDAGGFIPQLVFLSACLSAALVEAKDWKQLKTAVLSGGAGAQREPPPEVDKLLQQQPGYTSTALALLRSGVPQVIAMRYEVGDPYARDLAKLFYRHLLGDREIDNAESALSLARGEMLHAHGGVARQFEAVDHATPLILGHEGQAIDVPEGCSQQIERRRPQPQPLLRGGSRELDPPDNFVGRGAELTRLADEWLPRKDSDKSPQLRSSVALAQGLGGLGKTALAGEVINLWHDHFNCVFAMQAKPIELTADEFYRRMHHCLIEVSPAYQKKINTQHFAAVYLESSTHLKPDERYERMRNNALEALRAVRMLLVLDNFEKNLETVPSKDGYRCTEQEWDRLLVYFAERLPETRSRLLVTCRHRIAALPADSVIWLPLGPLPMADAMLFIQGNEDLWRLARDEKTWPLVERLLTISRGHPLILSRLAALAGEPAALEDALAQLEKDGLQKLPDVFASNLSTQQREIERSYLEDVTTHSVDLLIQRCTPEARRLLWIVTLANEAVFEELLWCVCSGHSAQDQQLRQVRARYQRLSPEEREEWLATAPLEIREQLKELLECSLHDDGPAQPLKPLLDELCSAGLLSRMQVDEVPVYSFHELVRERAAEWMDRQPSERGEQTAEQIWEAYGDWYASQFQSLLAAGVEGSRDAAVEAGRRALVYMVRAAAHQRLVGLASTLVTSTRNSFVLECVIAALRGVPDQIPDPERRWSLRTCLADALRNSGREHESLPFYEQAAVEAEQAGKWSDVAWIKGNWAHALTVIGQLEAAKSKHQESAEAERLANNPLVNVVASELEALRIDVMRGQARKAWPAIELRLNQVRDWWQRARAGESLAEAPNLEVLGRTLAGALNIAFQANASLKRWEVCLRLLEETEQLQVNLGAGLHERTITRFNAHGALLALGRLAQAQELLQNCLDIFRHIGAHAHEAAALSALAATSSRMRDLGQAVALERQSLALRNTLPDPNERAISHNHLANHLALLGCWNESAQHRLAAVAYLVTIGHEEHLLTALQNLGAVILHAAQAGQRCELPRLAALLALAEFQTLKAFLEQSGVPVDKLQATIDELDQAVRKKLAGA